jgi:hypothetical protein
LALNEVGQQVIVPHENVLNMQVAHPFRGFPLESLCPS